MQRMVALLLLASLNAFGFIDRVVVALVAQDVKAEFLVSDLEIGLLGGTAFALVNTFASLPIARLAERYRRSTVTALFLLVGSLFTTFGGLTSSFPQLITCRLGMAAGSAATEAPPHSIISDMYPPHQRASAISVFMLGIPVAALLGSFLGGTIAEQFGWRNSFLFFGLMGCGIALLCVLFLKEPARQTVDEDAPRPGTSAVLRIMLSRPTLRYLIIGACCVSLGSFGTNTFLPALFARDFGMGAGQAGLAFGLISGLASLIGTLIGGFGSERLARRDPRWLLAFPGLGLILGGPLFVIGLTSGALTLALPLMLIGSISFYTVMGPAIATLHGTLDSYSRATGSALFLLVMHLIGQGLGPPLVGMVSDALSAMLYAGGDFATQCTGAAAQMAGSPCATASAGGLRYAIAIFALFFSLGGGFLLLSARRGQSATPA